MRYYLIRTLFLFLVTSSVTFGQTTENFVKTYKARTETTSVATVTGGTPSQSYKSFTYLDGLGRPKQLIEVQRTFNSKDLIVPVLYDDFGRKSKEYRPYVEYSGVQDGRLRDNALDDHFTYYYNRFYGDGPGYYGVEYEPSPLNRVNKEAAPGKDWKMGSGNEVKHSRRANVAGEGVRIFTLTGTGIPVNSNNAVYAENTLWAEITDDEDGHRSISYTDKLGRVILKKVQGAASRESLGHMGWLCTYYVYDDLGQLRAVIPPQATEILSEKGWNLASNSTLSTHQYFRYTYDGRGRMTEKYLPGNAVVYLLYDLQDRPVGFQDGKLRTQNKWSYTQYDELGRVIKTGITVDATPVVDLRTALSLPSATWPASEGEVQTITYYDNYSGLPGLAYQDPGSTYPGFDPQPTTRVHGLPTGKKVRNLATGDLYTSAFYYDKKGQVIQTVSDNQLGGITRTSTRYNFEGQILETLTDNNLPDPITVHRRFEYNLAGDLEKIYHKINSGPENLLVQYSYFDIRELMIKAFPEVNGLNQTYSYNIRGGLRSIGSYYPEVYRQDLYYTAGQNIGKIDWKGMDGVLRKYEYSYDAPGRLTQATYSVPSNPSESSRYSLGDITYDANGNIRTMVRKGQRSDTEYDVLDNLDYSYPTNTALGSYSNRLTRVADAVSSNNYLSGDFKPNIGSTQNYAYDSNGNLTRNADKRISLITYNHLNLPEEISFSAGGKLKFAYDAEGNKLTQQVLNNSGVVTKTQEYVGEAVYLNGSLDYLVHEEGRVAYEDGNYNYEYFVKDHLGNVRQVLRNPSTEGLVATMETQSAEEEEMEFSMVSVSRQTEPEHNVTEGGNKVAWLNADRGRMVGPGRTQEIYAGDSLKLQVHGKYLENKKQKANAASFMAAGGKERLVADLNELALSTQRAGGANPIALLNLADILAKDLQKKEAPEAYMMYALYDQDSNRYEVGKKVLSKNAANQHEVLEEEMYISRDGYMETFVVNETSEDVWFDNMTVMSVSSPIVQETHYDPWGLELTGLGFQYGGIKANKYLYNSKELLNDLTLNLYDYGARYFDPVIGRWTSPDPMASERSWVSPYNFVQNNPILRVDPDGRLDDYYGIVNDELVYLGNDGQGNNIRLVSEGQHEQVLSDLNGVNTTDAQRATLRSGDLSQVVNFNEGNIQSEFQGVNDRTISNQLENSVTVMLDPATATVDAQPGAQGTATAVTNTYSSYNGNSGMWTNGGANLVLGDGHGHPTVTTPGMMNAPGYSTKDSNTAGSSGIATYTIDSYNSRVGGAATIHQARPGGMAGTNPVGTTQNTNGIGRRSFLHTARPYRP